MRKVIFFLLAILMLVLVSNNYKEEYFVIPDESIRIRIIPNSNNSKDQFLKKQVKNNLEVELYSDLRKSNTIDESRSIIKNNLNKYEQTVKRVLKNENSNQNSDVDYGFHYFPEKTYKGVKYEEGEYESLLVTLGKGEGDNWWCVLFPPICKIEEDSHNKEKQEYSLYIKEMFKKYIR